MAGAGYAQPVITGTAQLRAVIVRSTFECWACSVSSSEDGPYHRHHVRATIAQDLLQCAVGGFWQASKQPVDVMMWCQACLLKVRHMLVQVPEANNEGGGSNGHKESPGEPAHPRTVRQPIAWHVDGPCWQTALVQLQQPFVTLPVMSFGTCTPALSEYRMWGKQWLAGDVMLYSTDRAPRLQERTSTRGHSAAGSELSLNESATVR